MHLHQIAIQIGSQRETLNAREVTPAGLHGVFYDVVKRVDEDAATWLHEHRAPKPYTLAPAHFDRQVRELTRHNIILDESIQAFDDLLLAQRHNVAQAIGLKVNRMRDFCVATGIKMNIEDTGGSAIADTAAVHLAISTPAEFDRATWDCSQHHSVVTATGGYTKENGRAMVSDRAGLGIEVDLGVLGEAVAVYRS